MAPAFSKEAILQGRIDHLCLVCESHLRSERDVCLHVATVEHRQNLDSTDYVEKYRNDRVRKVNKWYFCELCNVLVSTLNSVKLHVDESGHVANRSAQVIARVDDVIVAGNTAINEEAWQGFVDETCMICNVEYDDQDVHRKEASHIINLIQSKVSDNSYRKIDNSTFHCLTCNEVVAEITEHLDGTKHKQALKQPVKIMSIEHEQDQKCTKSTDEKMSIPSTNKERTNHKQSSDILDSIPHFQKNNISINLEFRTAVCKKCSLNIEFNCKEIEKHIEEHKKNVQKEKSGPSPVLFENDEKEKNKTKDSVTLYTSPVFGATKGEKTEIVETKSPETTEQEDGDKIIQKMAEEYGLAYITSSNQVHCQMCKKYIPSSIEKIMAHVKEKFHKSQTPTSSKNNEILKKNVKKCNLKKVPPKQFISNILRVEGRLTDDIILNDEYCITIFSFFFFTTIGPNRFRCQICELNLPLQDVDDHKHRKLLEEIPVIIHPDLEFIREVRSDIYQCGYCNIIDSWEGIEDHLKSSDHKKAKDFAEWRLAQHLPKIVQQRVERQLQAFIMQLLLQ